MVVQFSEGSFGLEKRALNAESLGRGSSKKDFESLAQRSLDFGSWIPLEKELFLLFGYNYL
jgi:hypothetical protein